ncbi:MAG TPA: hypothetical protein VG015_00895 [Candidatus Dormibacteraeota bacterium]|nr:hypothetical protein [Candidatus Dormibacteraeota bacterium]
MRARLLALIVPLIACTLLLPVASLIGRSRAVSRAASSDRCYAIWFDEIVELKQARRGLSTSIVVNLRGGTEVRFTGRLKNWEPAIRSAMLAQTSARGRQLALRRLLDKEIWPTIPAEMIGHAPSPEEQDAILGYGPDGV